MGLVAIGMVSCQDRRAVLLYQKITNTRIPPDGRKPTRGREGEKRVIATLGRLDQLREDGKLEALFRFGARFCEKALLLSADEEGEAAIVNARRLGAVKVFERLWQETGCQGVVLDLLGSRRFEFPVDQAIFLSVLHRLIAPGSERACERWRQDYAIDGIEDLDLQHLYRAMFWLGEEQAEQQGATAFSPRCTKDRIEEKLFARRRDLFSHLELVFFDTTSICFEGEGGESLGQRGFSKDHRPDLKQMLAGAVLDEYGWPICCELWPGNTSDVKTLLPVAQRLSRRFAIQRVCLVADRGMISRETIEQLEKHNWPYILGARMRSQKQVGEQVPARAGRYRVVRTAEQDEDGPARHSRSSR